MLLLFYRLQLILYHLLSTNYGCSLTIDVENLLYRIKIDPNG